MNKSRDVGFGLLLWLVIAFGVSGLYWSTKRASTLDVIPEPPIEELRESTGFEEMEGPRSSKWPKVREDFVFRNPNCAACGSREELNVHHLKPFHLHPELELTPSNLITVCRKHHWEICHDPDGPWRPARPNWSHVNPKAKEHCDLVRSGRRY